MSVWKRSSMTHVFLSYIAYPFWLRCRPQCFVQQANNTLRKSLNLLNSRCSCIEIRLHMKNNMSSEGTTKEMQTAMPSCWTQSQVMRWRLKLNLKTWRDATSDVILIRKAKSLNTDVHTKWCVPFSLCQLFLVEFNATFDTCTWNKRCLNHGIP